MFFSEGRASVGCRRFSVSVLAVGGVGGLPVAALILLL
jgi:hypothetical protein